jgi:hypothetical protein
MNDFGDLRRLFDGCQAVFEGKKEGAKEWTLVVVREGHIGEAVVKRCKRIRIGDERIGHIEKLRLENIPKQPPPN